ncbi:MAG TPA: glycosyl hydrolase family 17 protein [Acetobacteraceae bacterium]|nr:glycosyl hydrolase family 17 protein [Acetobacteraceae bacterium]
MHRLAPLPVLLFVALLGSIILAWWLPNRPQAGDVGMAEARFNSVSFAPFRAGQSPLTDTFPSRAEVEADVALVATRARALRTYAANEGDYDVAEIAQRHGLKVWQGLWLGADRASNAREIAKAIALAHRYPDTIERVIVGNEVLLRRDLPAGDLIAAIDQVRAAVRQPVTYADVWEFWAQFPEVARHVDIVTIHLLPYWEDTPTGIDGAVAHVADVYRRMAALFPSKPIAVGETGWPSRGRWRDDAAPSVVNQAVFLRRFVALAHAEGFDYNLIEAFDQVWKYQNEGTVGANWGLWRSDRTPKFPLSGAVTENPDWMKAAAASGAFALLLLAFALGCGPPLPVGAQAGVVTLAAALGVALGYAWIATSPVLYDAYVRTAAVGNLGGQTLLAMLMMARAAALLSGAPVPPSRSGADATRAVQGLFHLRLPPLACWFDDLSFVFVWTAAVLEVMLVADPRYRDFPLPAFAVPLVAVVGRALLRDLPRGGGGREEVLAGAVLALCAAAGALREGPLNHQAQLWTVCAFILAAPPLLRCATPVRRRVPA